MTKPCRKSTLVEASRALGLSTAVAAVLLVSPVSAQDALPTAAAPPAARSVGPRLSDAQASQLAALIDGDAVTQGLRDGDARPTTVLGKDALVRSALDHAHAVHAGRVDVADFQRDWALRPLAYDPLPGFVEAVRRDRLAAWIASLPPPYSGYDTLVAGLARYRSIAAGGGWPYLRDDPLLKPGAIGGQVASLRKRLASEDPQAEVSGDRFDAAMTDAVRRAQRRYGLNPTGQVGTQTITALNVPVAARIRQIKANMERWRWLPSELDKNRVQVNIAAAVLTVFDGDTPVMSMKAVTGRPGDETPMLASRIHSIVFNPPWNVPSTIANRELFPKERVHPGYLARHGFRVIGDAGGRRLQQSSAHSALGKFKFDFDNPFAVYLHDTPAQAGFARFDRLASHGCVRLERPADLAKQLMRTTPQWPPQAIDAAVAQGRTLRATIAAPVAVYLLYWTAFASPDGQVSFRDDPYHWDGALVAKIAAHASRQSLTATP